MRYPIEQYDKHGFLKPPIWLWLGWLFLAKAWIVFVIAGVSRESGSQLLEMIYPIRESLYIGLWLGLPSIVMMWLIGLRHPERRWINRMMSASRGLTITITILHLGLIILQIVRTNHVFSWSVAVSGVILVWFLLFLINSKRVKTCLSSMSLE
ncbi:DUF2919 domain-containing protein [Vibrio sp. SCSIO 43136]|uniref:DUF2919 domain-containing protein n=1 Tax=Vibrio sp. SCSIO 43136 TaxID=2819101 RepID=UPI002074B973|nr:DUF2919 domain-containing protein [Vibrio sp. SCSIO 43136]USD65956.1 DUF2919 domain-containing protein [Vibrio sp. SCSIO 43136]